MQTYVINLARSHERRAQIESQLGHVGTAYEIVQAVDGRELDLEDAAVVDPAYASPSGTRPGVIGCSLSHLKAYREILEAGHEVACILEDDVILPADLNVLVSAVSSRMTGASVVLLNFQSRGPIKVARFDSPELPSSRALVRPVDVSQVASTGCYVITREACLRMSNLVLPVTSPADDWDRFVREKAIDELRCVLPMPVIQDSEFRTTMSHHRPDSLYARLREAVATTRFPLVRHVIATRRRRLWRERASGEVLFVDESPEPGRPG